MDEPEEENAVDSVAEEKRLEAEKGQFVNDTVPPPYALKQE